MTEPIFSPIKAQLFNCYHYYYFLFVPRLRSETGRTHRLQRAAQSAATRAAAPAVTHRPLTVCWVGLRRTVPETVHRYGLHQQSWTCSGQTNTSGLRQQVRTRSLTINDRAELFQKVWLQNWGQLGHLRLTCLAASLIERILWSVMNVKIRRQVLCKSE